MEVKIDLRVAELLTSRLCHDLVGPIGAVGNGLELLTETSRARAMPCRTAPAWPAGPPPLTFTRTSNLFCMLVTLNG
jgi:hypothetical protein